MRLPPSSAASGPHARANVQRHGRRRAMAIADPFGKRLRFCERDAQSSCAPRTVA
ncbi:glyoxalase [Burkholderia mallei]|uniref:Glyoxalase n=2 Tax=pseudomallei group TaxID=111527 RepID=A0AAX1X0C4_BURML|nr:glyoxalase/bleomycin resistance protein/dioxygenase [Burkholderia mallei SAVP1]AUG22607.1 glyoxalase [Burkholderia pseudomallei]EEH24197.1 conserved hypothetical protein [Burkholderia pseudomallei Pakistan 9]EES44686.1 conserved hypothetical protein [Burkholderia mallei PRL-20]KGV24400.1 putative glyoxalase/bleomycin resistance protein/dioxygenase [Burkholderia pseudomallei MSHR4462]KGX44385.1 putative glyoxalase/bleomycin resistance protein/dioxygenase [Burkholderia pseudomallei MSHR3709]